MFTPRTRDSLWWCFKDLINTVPAQFCSTKHWETPDNQHSHGGVDGKFKKATTLTSAHLCCKLTHISELAFGANNLLLEILKNWVQTELDDSASLQVKVWMNKKNTWYSSLRRQIPLEAVTQQFRSVSTVHRCVSFWPVACRWRCSLSISRRDMVHLKKRQTTNRATWWCFCFWFLLCT